MTRFVFDKLRRWKCSRVRTAIAIVALSSIALTASALGRQARRASGFQQDVYSCATPSDARIDACTRVLNSGLLNASKRATAFAMRGNAYNANGDYDRAITDFDEAIRIDAALWFSFFGRASAYDRLNKLELALADLIEAQRLAPNVLEIKAALASVRAELAVRARSVPRNMSSGDVKALQQRLASDGCYRGTMDAQPSPALDAAIKACPTQDPILRIETGQHTSAIPSIATDAACRILATTSLDKTTRLWSAKDRHLLRTLRVPIDNDNGGAGYTVAVSPDGHFVATAGWDAQYDADGQDFIYVFDATTGALIARPFGGTDSISSLAFSRDGRWLAAAVGTERSEIRVYATSDWRLAMSDTSYGHKAIYALAFGTDGSFFAAGYDGHLRRYGPGPGFPLEREVALSGGARPSTIAVDPRGELLAIGFHDSTALALLESATLRFDFAADTHGINDGSLSAVAWDNDGEQLFAGGQYRKPDRSDWRSVVVTFNRNGRRVAETNVSNDTLSHLSSCGSGVAIAGNGFGVLDGTGKLDWSGMAAIDMRGKVRDAFTISPDAKAIRFDLEVVQPPPSGTMPMVDPVVFDLSNGTFGAAPNPIPGFIAPATSTLRIHGDHLFRPGERPNVLAIEPDRSGFAFGSNEGIHAFAADASARWEIQSPRDTFGLNISADGRLIIAADADGTFRWRRWSDGKELLALFVDKANRRWVAWTPSGYYMASPGGEDLIGWQINRGWDQAADFFPASRFRARFNRPDIVRLVLDTLDEDAAIKQANAAAGRTEDAQPLIAQLPPLIRVLDPDSGAHVPEGRVTIGYSFRSPSGLPVDRIVVTVNGRPVKEVGLPVHALSGDQETKGSVSVTLSARDSDVGLIAWSGDMASQAAHVDVVWDGAPATTAAGRKLYALVVGVGDYADADMKLAYAAKDAKDFAKTLTDQQGLYYGTVQTRVLTDREVTRASMSDGLSWLKTMATSPDDVSILFLAGHGLTDAKGTYWFFPADADADTMSAKGVSQEAMRQSMQSLKGKVLWFLDTCHAGAAAKRAPVDIDVLLNTVTAAENGGIVVFASSTGRQVSVESKDLGNGAFTKALVEGIAQGKAVSYDGSKVTTSSLDGFVEATVSQLTGGQQTPVMERPPQEHDFTIAVVRK